MKFTVSQTSRGWPHQAKRNVCLLGIGLVSILFAEPLAQAQQFTVLYTFTGADGTKPIASLVRDNAGNLFGTTEMGGTFNGVVFKIDASGMERVLYRFDGHLDGKWPSAGVILDPAGNLYGTSEGGALRWGTAFKLNTAGKETVLYTFGRRDEPANPQANFIMDASGNLYSTSAEGGNPACQLGCGTVFKLTQEGKETALHIFAGNDGQAPVAPLIRDSAGNFYGTTSKGGSGGGVVFKLDETGKEKVLYSFTGTNGGEGPNSPLVRDAAGNVYGTTLGDFHGVGGSGYGTVFKLDSKGKLTVFYSFAGMPDGAFPQGSLFMDSQGSLYGTTIGGGGYGQGCPSDNGTQGCGVVFKVDSTGKETVLHTFTGGSDGGNPQGGLISDGSGALYGTASVGGTFNSPCAFLGCGVVFRLVPQ
jgi:uncharacterized repeat protein (TIGR03803 family)